MNCVTYGTVGMNTTEPQEECPEGPVKRFAIVVQPVPNTVQWAPNSASCRAKCQGKSGVG